MYDAAFFQFQTNKLISLKAIWQTFQRISMPIKPPQLIRKKLRSLANICIPEFEKPQTGHLHEGLATKINFFFICQVQQNAFDLVSALISKSIKGGCLKENNVRRNKFTTTYQISFKYRTNIFALPQPTTYSWIVRSFPMNNVPSHFLYQLVYYNATF